MNVPDKHKAVAHAWVDGAQIEFQTINGDWEIAPKPSWRGDCEYRIKKVEYPVYKVAFKSSDDGEWHVSDNYYKSAFEFVGVVGVCNAEIIESSMKMVTK